MILEYEQFAQKLDAKLFEGSSKGLIEKIAQYPDRYLGHFRPTNARTKLMQNITQSHEIKFGDALENVFEEYFEKLGFEILPKKLAKKETSNNKTYNIDQLFKKGDTVYLIEQKVRDDHDSTKKVGQFENFERKYYEVCRKYPGYNIIPIMWFIDPSLNKNKIYYIEEMAKMAKKYGCSPKLYYGKELFSNNLKGISDIPYEMWEEIEEYLKKWKETLPDLPEINFDSNAEEVFEEIKNIKPNVYMELFQNKDIAEQILPIIFTTGEVLKMLATYFHAKSGKEIYATLEKKANEYIEKHFK